MILYQMSLLLPAQVSNLYTIVNQKLCDADFSVVQTALNIIYELSKVCKIVFIVYIRLMFLHS